MNYPVIDDVTKFLNPEDGNQDNGVFDVMLSCIGSVVQGDTVYNLEDFSDEEVLEFVDSFSTQTIEDIKEFFETIPVMRCEQTYTNADGEEKKVVLEGVETFFI